MNSKKNRSMQQQQESQLDDTLGIQRDGCFVSDGVLVRIQEHQRLMVFVGNSGGDCHPISHYSHNHSLTFPIKPATRNCPL